MLAADLLSWLLFFNHPLAEADAAGGFSYHQDHDAWKCPEDQWLWPQSFDPDHRVMRYRGSPSICNACSMPNRVLPKARPRT